MDVWTSVFNWKLFVLVEHIVVLDLDCIKNECHILEISAVIEEMLILSYVQYMKHKSRHGSQVRTFLQKWSTLMILRDMIPDVV